MVNNSSCHWTSQWDVIISQSDTSFSHCFEICQIICHVESKFMSHSHFLDKIIAYPSICLLVKRNATAQQYHIRITKWFELERNLKPIHSNPQPRAGLPHTGWGCPGPHPAWPWTPAPLRMGYLPPNGYEIKKTIFPPSKICITFLLYQICKFGVTFLFIWHLFYLQKWKLSFPKEIVHFQISF